MTAKTGCNAFGWGNLITIIIVLMSAIGNFAYLSAKVEQLDEKVTQEMVDRKVEDRTIRLEIDAFYIRNTEDHKVLLEGITGIQKDLTFHLGLHAGTETQKDQ